MISLYTHLKHTQTDNRHENYAVVYKTISADQIKEVDNTGISSRGNGEGSSSNNRGSSSSNEEIVENSGDSS